jgi:N,N'-diacetyllegionaminate synthase
VRVLSRYHEQFGCKVGFSDHTQTSEAALAAVALGAVVIEKHLTLDTSMEGPDHSSSLDPEGFAEYVSSIRRLENVLGSDEKWVTPSEADNQPLIRKGLFARKAIAAGAEFTSENVIAKRPVSSVPASRWPHVKGQLATRSYEPDDPLQVTP